MDAEDMPLLLLLALLGNEGWGVCAWMVRGERLC